MPSNNSVSTTPPLDLRPVHSLPAGHYRASNRQILRLHRAQTHLIITLALFVLSCLIYPILNSYALLVLVRFIHGAAFGVASTTISSTVITLIPLGRLSEGLGYISLAGTVSNAVGPLAAIQLSERASSLWVFGFTTICAIVALLSVLPMTVKERTQRTNTTADGAFAARIWSISTCCQSPSSAC